MTSAIGRVLRILLAASHALVCLCAFASGTEQDPAGSSVMTVDQAVDIALANNRSLKIVSIGLDSSKEKVAAAKTKRLPGLHLYTFGSELLTPIGFTIPAGQFGDYKATGPIPATNTDINTPARPTVYIYGTASQPLLSLYKINLHVQSEVLSLQQSVQDLREQRNTIVNDVRQAYYSVVEIENVIAATQASIKQYEELDRITLEYVSEKVVLESDSLEVKAKLADQKLKLLQAQDKFATAKETLNNLLGRDLETDFEVTQDKELAAFEQDLKTAQTIALEQNPKVKEAQIKIQQADNVRRLAKSEYIPDMGIAFHYLSPFNVNFLPTNIMSVGIEINWEPFDWGRRKDVVNEKTYQVEQSKLNLADVKSNVLVNVNSQFRTLQEARLAVDVATAQQEATRVKLREITSKYEQKNVLLRDVLQQQAAVEKANADYNEAIASFWTAKANFDKALGTE